jgi:hypothetical protein
MRRHLLVLASAVAALTLVGISNGCQAILNISDPVASHLWCLNADPAIGLHVDSQLFIQIKHPDGMWMRGCKCYCPADHAIMVEGSALGLQPGDVLWRLNGIELRTLADVGHAFEVLDQATVLTADIDRGSRTLTRSYHRVDLAKHP